ncbi:MAG TPA: hypothetical protein VG708_09080 [Mycobacteriales bacterium]|nr:hypothetical protein [Mycobacteriales bacterium]
MDIADKLDALAEMVRSARAMPMSASCVINRAEVLDAIDDMKAALPKELAAARGLLKDRSSFVEEGQAEADAILEAARAEQARLVSRTEVAKEASREAERMVAAAQAEVDRMRREVDDYVDGKLANFEIALSRTLAAVEHGREKINGRNAELEALGADEEIGEPIAEPLPG